MKRISAGTDGGPCSQVCARLTLQKLCWPILTISEARNWQNVSVSGPEIVNVGQHSFWPPEEQGEAAKRSKE